MKQFFEDSIATRLNVTDRLELESAFLGKSKDALDEIDITLTLDTAVPLFGPFLRFHTCSAAEQPHPPVYNAFSILMASQKELLTPGLPPPLSILTKKEKLYNDFITMLEE